MSDNSPQETWTVMRLLTWTANYLANHGSESPRLDAEVLLAHCMNCTRIMLYASYALQPSEEVRSTFKKMILMRAQGMPVAYLVGKKEFFSLDFQVSPDVLIPRPETEFILVELLDQIKACNEKNDYPWRICDVGTGSGILAVTAAVHLAHAHLTALDISPKALSIAKKNALDHHVTERITFLESDLFSALTPESLYHYILSNPPYISRDEMEQLPKDVMNYEPHLALYGGTDGMDIIRRLYSQCVKHLEPLGFILVEISPMIHQHVLEIITHTHGLKYVKTIRDMSRLERVVVAQRDE